MELEKLELNYKCIYFDDVSYLYKKKTLTFYCRNNISTNLLGTVKWFSQWRQYCFFPSCDTIFNSICLENIKSFMVQLNKGHKNKGKK